METVDELIPGLTGRLESARREAVFARQRQAELRLPRRRLVELLRRSDRILVSLEELNLSGATRVPYPWLSQLADLIADLPFAFPLPVVMWPSPTEGISTVFDVQDGLLRCLSGRPAADDDRLEQAS